MTFYLKGDPQDPMLLINVMKTHLNKDHLSLATAFQMPELLSRIVVLWVGTVFQIKCSYDLAAINWKSDVIS